MTREQLALLLMTAARIADDDRILVLGSQAVLASWPDEDLPDAATRSVEADLAWFYEDGTKWNDVDWQIGEMSAFEVAHGFYAQGVEVSTAVLPAGWEGRLVRFPDPSGTTSNALCLDPHDLVVAKLVAGREKDREFAAALLNAGLVRVTVLSERANALPDSEGVRRRSVVSWLQSWQSKYGG